MHRKPSRLTITLAASTVVVAGAAAAGAVVLWPASTVTTQTTVARTAHAGPVWHYVQGSGQPVLDAAGIRQLQFGKFDPQRSIAAAHARKARAAKRAAARAAARRAAQRAAQQQAAQQQAAQQQAAQQQPAQQQPAQQPTQQTTVSSAPSGSPQQIAMAMLGSYGWSSSQFSCLDSLWNQESGWNVSAANPSSGAYGIPQALPGSKMASAGSDWQTSAATQIRWGLGYIQGTYGSPCGAWAHEEADGWY
jgi:hypothetical protein